MPLSKAKKSLYFTKLENLLETYTKCFVVAIDNVGSKQIQQTRIKLRGVAEMIMGKNTLIRTVFASFLEKNPGHDFANLVPHINGNVGFIFTNGDLSEIRTTVVSNIVPAPARPGAIAPIDVVVPAGPTGCDPGQTNFFQVLQIPTKISKGQIEITGPVNLIHAGDKVGASEAALLDKLSIRPFSYGMTIAIVYDNGSCFSADILSITEDILVSKFSAALSVVAAISLQIGFPTQASVAHSVGKAFQAIVAVAVGLDKYSFKEADEFKAFLADPSAFAVAAPAAGGDAPAAAAAAPEPEVEEVDALEGGMDMFGGDDGY